MYKGASANLQKRLSVDRPHPSRGYIDGPSDEHDAMPDVSALSPEDLRAEQKQLRSEVLRAEQLIAVAKASGNKGDREIAGQRKVALTLRLSAINARIKVQDGPSEYGSFVGAAREIYGDAAVLKLFERAREMRKALPSPAELGKEGEGA